MMEKGKSKWVAVISILVAVIIGAAGYFLYRYYQARRIFEENARTVCGEVEELIAEEKFQEASDKISETEKKFIDYGRSQLTGVFLNQLQAEEVNASAEVTLEKVVQCMAIRNLAEALETDPAAAPELENFSEDRLAEDFLKQLRADKVYDETEISSELINRYGNYRRIADALEMDPYSAAVQYIDGILSLKEEAKYHELIRMVEDNAGDYRKADVMIDLIIKNLVNYPKTAESIVSELNIIANLTFSEYDRRAYGIQDYIKSVYNFGIIIGNFLQSDYTQSNLNNLKDQLRNNIVEWTDIKLEAIDSMERISSVLEKLPNF